MAQQPISTHMQCISAPFCWRLLTPSLVHILPAPPSLGFVLLTIASLCLTSLAVSWMIAGFGLGPGASAWGGLAFATLGPATGTPLYNTGLVDPLAFLLLACAVGAVVRARHGTAAAAMVSMAAAKETVLVAVVFQARKVVRERGPYAWALAGTVGALGVLAAVRLVIPVRPGEPYSTLYEFGLMSLRTVSPASGPPRILAATVGTWGFLLPFAILQLTHPPRLWRRPEFTYAVMFATAQVLVSADVSRVVVYGFPLVILAVAVEIEHLSGRSGRSAAALWAPVIAAQAIWSIPFDLGNWVAPPNTLLGDPALAATQLGLLLVTVVAILAMRRPGTGAPSP